MTSDLDTVRYYLSLSVELARLGAELRKDGREDEDWTADEDGRWGDVVGRMDAIWVMLGPEGRAAIAPVERLLAEITRGEWRRVENQVDAE